MPLKLLELYYLDFFHPNSHIPNLPWLAEDVVEGFFSKLDHQIRLGGPITSE